MIKDLNFIRKARILVSLEKKLEKGYARGVISEAEYILKKEQASEKLSDLRKRNLELIDAKVDELDRGREEFDRLLRERIISQENHDSFVEKLSRQKTELESEREVIGGLGDEEYFEFLEKQIEISKKGEEEGGSKQYQPPSIASFMVLLCLCALILVVVIAFIPLKSITQSILINITKFTTTLGSGIEPTTSTVSKTTTKTVEGGVEPTTTTSSKTTTTSKVIESTTTTVKVSVSMPRTEYSHFGFMHPEEGYMEARALGVHWERPHPGQFIWNVIQPTEGKFDWSGPDKYVEKSQAYGFNIIATIWPYAEWDQKKCHRLAECEGSGFDKFGELPKYRCRPCSMEAYSDFVKKLVERYDGDGVEDMPGLKYPIRYWEASNEPEMQEEELTFFKGSSDDYLEILTATYNAVKVASADAKVLHAGFAGMGEGTMKFWKPILGKGGGDYFDIANIHSVGQDDEHLFTDEMKKLLMDYSLDKPVWITEVQYNGRDGSKSKEDFARLLARSFTYAFGNGAQKIFYTGLTSPSPGHDNAALLDKEDKKNPTYYSYKMLVEKLDYFEFVERLSESQYKFVVDGKPVWVLWGSGPLAGEITGRVNVTDIEGNVELIDAREITLSNSPVFVERVE